MRDGVPNFGFCNWKPEIRNSEPSLHTTISLKTAAYPLKIFIAANRGCPHKLHLPPFIRQNRATETVTAHSNVAPCTPIECNLRNSVSALFENSAKSRSFGALQRISAVAKVLGHMRHAKSYSFHRYSLHMQHCPPIMRLRNPSGMSATGSNEYDFSSVMILPSRSYGSCFNPCRALR